jgi:CubicO group peptidase (beta-lactamase class C family)
MNPLLLRVRAVVVPLSATLLGCSPGAATPAPAPVVHGEIGSQLDRFLTAEADSGFSGVVLVSAGGEPVLHRAYGWADRSRRSPLTLGSRFWIGSLSKSFAAGAILALEQEGRLRLADSIGKYFPGVPGEKRAITLHHLLTHTSGLGHNYAADGIRGRDQAAAAILSRPLEGSPGAGFRYSNDGYSLLAIIVEIASGRPYEEHLSDGLLRPAGLRQTGFWGSATPEPPVGTTAERSRLTRLFGDLSARGLRRPNWGYRGASGLYCTAGDLFRWGEELHRGDLLPAASRNQMLTAHAPAGRRGSYGYGWFLSTTDRGTAMIEHGGNEDWLGHNAILRIYPDEEITIIVLSNAGQHADSGWSRRVAAGVERMVFGTNE